MVIAVLFLPDPNEAERKGAWDHLRRGLDVLDEKAFTKAIGPVTFGMPEGGRNMALHYFHSADHNADCVITEMEFYDFLDAVRLHEFYRGDDVQDFSKMRNPKGAPKGGTWIQEAVIRLPGLQDVANSMSWKRLVYIDPDGYRWDESGTCITPGYQYDNDESLY